MKGYLGTLFRAKKLWDSNSVAESLAAAVLVFLILLVVVAGVAGEQQAGSD